jgi:hypothetical protein
MGLLRENFSSSDSAKIKIAEGISNYYKTEYADFYSKNKNLIDTSITSVQLAYGQNTFPKMKVAYDLYPEHIGHLETNGCFRCHNDSFKSGDGRVITKDCNLCHTIVGQGSPGKMEYTNIRENLEFHHPVDVGTAWKDSNCSECHLYLY